MIQGMLFIVTVQMTKIVTNERIIKKLLMVGNDHDDLSSKIRWFFDKADFDSIEIKKVEKVREKIHTLSTRVTELESFTPAPNEQAGSATRHCVEASITPTKRLYAVGLATSMLGRDENDALRRVGRALVDRSFAESSAGPKLSEDATIFVEELSTSSHFARPRDVSSEKLRAHFVRG